MFQTSLNNNLLKKKLKEVPVTIKINALKELERGASVYDIARELDVNHTTVRLWKKNKDILLRQNCSVQKSKKRFRKERYDKINKAVWIWFKTARASGIPISGPMVQAKALQFSAEFKENDTFTASSGWLRSWKNNYGISSKKICGEKLSADSEAVNPFKESFENYVQKEGLTPHQVFNADESRLYYKLLPKVTLCEQTNESPAGTKVCKEAVTVMACSNASGTYKLPLVIIGKYAKPRCLRKEESLPVLYMHQKKAWMTGGLFKSWFEDKFVPSVKEFLKSANLPCKALLLIDNCASHNSTLSIDGITVSFFPPNTTSLIQPMDQGCLQTLKLLYKKCLMKYTVHCIDKKMSVMDITKSITLKEAIYWAADAWHEVSANTIQKSWNRVWPWAERVKMCQIYSLQQQQILHLFERFYNYLQNQQASTTLNVSDLQKWLHSIHTDIESDLTVKDIVQIVENDEQQNTNDSNSNFDQFSEEDDDINKENNKNNGNNNYDDCDCDDNRYCNNNIHSSELPDKTENICDINNESLSLITEVDAKLCLNFLRDYCIKNNYPKSIQAIDIIAQEIL